MIGKNVLHCQKMGSGSSNTGQRRSWSTLSTVRMSGNTRRWFSSLSSRESPSSTSSTSSLLACSSPHSVFSSSTCLPKVLTQISIPVLRHLHILLNFSYKWSILSATSWIKLRQQPKKTFPSLNEIFSAFCSWWPEVHHVYCHSSGPDCFPLPYRQEGPRDVEGSATDWQVSFSLW